MITGWEKRGACRTNIESPDIVRKPKFRGYLETRDRESFDLRGVKKNDMRMLRQNPSKLLRQKKKAYSGFILWGDADISGIGNPAGAMSKMQESKGRKIGVVVKQSFLHKEVFFLCGPKMSCNDHSGCIQRAEIGLAYGQGVRQGIYAGAASAESGGSA